MRFRQTHLLLAGISVLSGCMRIYPDPELPDVEATWYVDECEADAVEIELRLVGIDRDTRVEGRARCDDGAFTFKDVGRERFQLEATMLDASGEVFSEWTTEVDLRDGSDERAYLYFELSSGMLVAWTFAGGGSCASLGADTVAIDLLPDGDTLFAACAQHAFYGNAQRGTFAVQLRAEASGETVAISNESEVRMFGSGVVDVGSLELMPCDGPCEL